MNAHTTFPRRQTLGELAQAVFSAEQDWLAADKANDEAAFSQADAAFSDARRAFEAALLSETGISREMFQQLGIVL